MTMAHDVNRVLVIDGVQCVCTVHHEPDPGVTAQVRSILVESLVRSLINKKAAESE
jgi:predicted ATP-dependent serine protease